MQPSKLARRSPEKAFESLYRRHFREIFGYTLALLHSPADAEDATQATFLNAYRALERGEHARHPASWLRSIALNVCREHFRRASRRPDEVSLDDDPGEPVVEPIEPALGDVIRALSHLPFNQRASLVMREFEGRSVGEIAGLLDLSSSAVETLLFRARRALREQLEGSLGCDEAERAISRQLDGALPRSERAALRAHLRACPECASLARRLRAQGSVLKSLALVPVPAALASIKMALSAARGGTSTTASASMVSAGAAPVAIKAVGVTVFAALAVGAGYVTIGRHGQHSPAIRHAAATAPAGSHALSGGASAEALPMRAVPATVDTEPLERASGAAMLSAARRERVRADARGRSGQPSETASSTAAASRSATSNAASGGGARLGRGHAYGRARTRTSPPTRAATAHKTHGRVVARGHTGSGRGSAGSAKGSAHAPPSQLKPPKGNAKK